MFRELLKKLSGAQLTAIIIAGIFIPGAVGATVAFTAVAIVDPNTGTQAAVDGGRRLYVYDPIAGYSNNPLFLVNIRTTSSAGGGVVTAYTVPTGKALVIKSMQYNYYANAPGNDIYAYFSSTSRGLWYNLEESGSAATATQVFEAGVVLHSGDALTWSFGSTDGSHSPFLQVYIQGYLVPSGAAPAAGTPMAQAQFVSPALSTGTSKQMQH